MKFYEYGTENIKTLLFFQATAEPWWIFEPSAKSLADEFHVFLVASDGHDPSQDNDYESVEKNTLEAAGLLREKGITHLDAIYGPCIGGASALRFLVTQDITVDKVIIDSGLTPYKYPKWICRLISVKDYVMIKTVVKNRRLLEKVSPPERWTPEGCDPVNNYDAVFDFLKNHYSSRTIYNAFWSGNNYTMPDPVPPVPTKIEYWYGSLEKKERKGDVKKDTAYMKRNFPQTVFRELDGYSHLEMVICHPEEFRRTAMRFLKEV